MRLLKIAGRDPDGNAKPFSLTDNGEALVKESPELSQQIEDIKDKDFATETTLETIDGVLDSILAKIIAAPATAAKQDAAKEVLDAIAGKDFATQTTLAAILAKLSADPATQTTLNALKTLFDSGNAQVQLKGSKTRVSSPPVTGVKTVTGVAAEIFAGASRKAGRSRLVLRNMHSSLRFRVGSPTVTDTTGFGVEPQAVVEIDIDPASDVPWYAVSEAGAIPVEVMEA